MFVFFEHTSFDFFPTFFDNLILIQFQFSSNLKSLYFNARNNITTCPNMYWIILFALKSNFPFAFHIIHLFSIVCQQTQNVESFKKKNKKRSINWKDLLNKRIKFYFPTFFFVLVCITMIDIWKKTIKNINFTNVRKKRFKIKKKKHWTSENLWFIY